MSASDSLENLVRDLQAMPPRARRAILRALTDAERAALADCAGPGSTPVDDAVGTNRFSPWLSTRIRQAQHRDALNPLDRMTAATRDALLRGVDDMIGSERPRGPRPSPASGRSLFEAFGGFLSPGGARR
ncbi:hypothetical protein GCM10009087_11270 [Sphingomonas oligophenolica]|uniref:Uncharacterized protein n=1 Tax=Sphingomonas oligophenolica TaxID=301154 RepID=A0ABU9Y409_9SPHN